MNACAQGRPVNHDLTHLVPAPSGRSSSPELAWENEGGHLLPERPDDVARTGTEAPPHGSPRPPREGMPGPSSGEKSQSAPT